MKQWDQSRQAHETLIARFGNSPWVHEARYGIGWAWQNQKQYDQAINIYSQVTSGTATEIAAKAQLNIGLCRLEQKRYLEAANAFLVVSSTYDYPEVNAIALTEAARAYAELKQHDQAARLLKRVIKDHPQSKWAEVAKERLAALQKG
jgi:TolA-binding protein